MLDTSQTSSEALRAACQWLKLVTVAELKQYSQLQDIQASLAARQVSYQQQSEAAKKRGDSTTEQKAGGEVVKIEDVIKELRQLLEHPDNNHQPFNDPYHYSAFICQGLA